MQNIKSFDFDFDQLYKKHQMYVYIVHCTHKFDVFDVLKCTIYKNILIKNPNSYVYMRMIDLKLSTKPLNL